MEAFEEIKKPEIEGNRVLILGAPNILKEKSSKAALNSLLEIMGHEHQLYGGVVEHWPGVPKSHIPPNEELQTINESREKNQSVPIPLINAAEILPQEGQKNLYKCSRTEVTLEPYFLNQRPLPKWLGLFEILDSWNLQLFSLIPNNYIMSFEAPLTHTTLDPKNVICLYMLEEERYFLKAAGFTGIDVSKQNGSKRYLYQIYAALSEEQRKQWLIKCCGNADLYSQLKEVESHLNNEISLGKLPDHLKNLYAEIVTLALSNNLADFKRKGGHDVLNFLEKTASALLPKKFPNATENEEREKITPEYNLRLHNQLQKAFIRLNRDLYGKPPMNPELKTALVGVLGGLIGFVIGAAAGAMMTWWAGGVGAIPLGLFVSTIVTTTLLGGTLGSILPMNFCFFISKHTENKWEKQKEESPFYTSLQTIEDDIRKMEGIRA